jgi:hypothetical protein
MNVQFTAGSCSYLLGIMFSTSKFEELRRSRLNAIEMGIFSHKRFETLIFVE